VEGRGGGGALEDLGRRLAREIAEIYGCATDLRLVGLGAEAALFRASWAGMDSMIKYRYPKPYRDPDLDLALRARRTALEGKLLVEARISGVAVPAVLFVDAQGSLLVTDYLPGPKLRDVLEAMDPGIRAEVFRTLGSFVGRLHHRGIVHGDLTTSNVIMVEGRPFVIDFGLGSFSNELEEFGVDVHLMLRALESTHPSVAGELYEEFMRGYEAVRGAAQARAVRGKVAEIRRRGRYVAERRKRS